MTSETITLGPRGRRLWVELTASPPDPAARVLIEEACRLTDRLDKLDRILTGRDDQWMRFQLDETGSEVTVVLDKALAEARQQALALKAVLSELRQGRGKTRTPSPGPSETPKGTGGGVADLSARLAARRAAGQ